MPTITPPLTLVDLLAEAATEIANLDSPQNPVVLRIRAALKPPTKPIDFRALVQYERQMQGLSQVKLGELAEMSQPSLSDWLLGKSDINAETLQRVLFALKIRL